MGIDTVGVVGAGTMGSGIAQLALQAGHTVLLFDADSATLTRGRERIREGLGRRASRLDLDAAAMDGWVEERLGRCRPVATAHDLAAASDLVIEAVVAPATDPAVADRACAIVEAWGKTAVRCTDSPGFIVNRVNRPITLEALAIVRAGGATVDRVDRVVGAAGFPMGPFELMDLVGLDINLAAARGIFEALVAAGDPLADRSRPSPIQERMVLAGHLGQKMGGGFYAYDPADRPTDRPTGRPARPVSGRSPRIRSAPSTTPGSLIGSCWPSSTKRTERWGTASRGPPTSILRCALGWAMPSGHLNGSIGRVGRPPSWPSCAGTRRWVRGSCPRPR